MLLDHASFSQNKSSMSDPVIDDIPEAVRDTPLESFSSPAPSPQRFFPWRILGLTALGLGAILGISYQMNPLLVKSLIPAPLASPITAPASPTPTAVTSPEAVPAENILGHLPYEEAPADNLKPINANGSLKLRAAAAESFLAMQAAAWSEGIDLTPLSGFRSITDQEHLFFDVKAERGQVATKRAEVSAPPGYSEHHTGYAVDIGDGAAADTHLSVDFENTLAFAWLKANAPYYSFELSFPKDNLQGISYEPWHWRYVGDRHSLETFYKAQSLLKSKQASPEPSPSNE